MISVEPYLSPLGMYLIEPGRPVVRQSVADLYAARRDNRELPGYEPHECSGPPHWTDR